MSIEAKNLALEQKVYELTDKFETVEQSRQLLELEKEEYLEEIEKLKYLNSELLEKLNFLQTISKDSKQQALLLSRQLSTNSSELDAETIANHELNKRIKSNIKIINKLTKENELFRERNKNLEIKLENINNKYNKFEIEKLNEIEEYKTKIIELSNEKDILQIKLDSMPYRPIEYAGSNSSFIDVNDDEEKSYDISDINNNNTQQPNNPQLNRDKTLDLKASSMFSGSYNTQRSGSIVSISKGSVIMTPMSHSFLKRQTSLKKLHGFPMLNELSENNNNNMVFTDEFEYDDEFDNDELMQTQFVNNQSVRRSSVASYASYISNGQYIFDNRGQSPKEYDINDELINEKIKIIMEQQLKINELEELIHREEIGYEIKIKVLNNKNNKLMEQLTEKDKIIKKCTRQITDLKEEYKMQKKKLIDDWKSEKDKLLVMCNQCKNEKNKIVENDLEKINKLEKEIYDFRREYMGIKNKFNEKIKLVNKLKKKNRQLEMMLTAPKNSNCYSVTEWFKFS